MERITVKGSKFINESGNEVLLVISDSVGKKTT